MMAFWVAIFVPNLATIERIKKAPAWKSRGLLTIIPLF